MIRPSVDAIIDVMNAKGYRVYDTPGVDYNLNIVGIRSFNPQPREFDDTLVIFHRFRGVWDIYNWHITTDPGIFYLLNPPADRPGTAILKEGQYRGVYKIDIHGRGRPGSHLALCQRLGNVTVYRDSNRDDSLNLIPGTEQTGKFGINIHKARSSDTPLFNWKASAGCQVFADHRQFNQFMQMCKFGRDAFGNKFTYTLLHERDFS